MALRDRGLQKDIQLVAYYYTPAVHLRIGQGSVAAAPTDQMVIQSRIAVDQAVRLLEGKEMATGGSPEFGDTGRTVEHIGPQLIVVDKASYKAFDTATTLGAEGWKPVFNVD